MLTDVLLVEWSMVLGGNFHIAKVAFFHVRYDESMRKSMGYSAGFRFRDLIRQK
jgi:hypothetical protein